MPASPSTRVSQNVSEMLPSIEAKYVMQLPNSQWR